MFVNFFNFYLYNLFKLYLTDAKDSEKSTPVPTPGCSPYYGPLEKDKCEEVIAKKPKKSKHKDRSKRSRSRSPRRRRRQSRSPSPVRKLNRYNLCRLSKLLTISSEPAEKTLFLPVENHSPNLKYCWGTMYIYLNKFWWTVTFYFIKEHSFFY